MTRPIDEKIVAMKLDNSDFTQKAAKTTGLLGKLQGALNKIPGVNLGKTTKELGAIGQQTDNIKMNKLAESVNFVASRFSNLGIVGITVLQNLTNRAVDAGLALTKSLSLDQVIAGFQEYELKIGSIRTIMANTEWDGTTLDDVKGSLEELNDYADQTIYNFGQMTDNIGRFTAAGVKLDDSTMAIKGLSNLAATSGAQVHQLNTAMYQMSQAMAAGTFNLMDWNSLTNAGMGGKILQDGLLDTAKNMGVVVDTSEGFRQSISDGWLTAEVFLETMKKFSEDESMIEAATKVRTFSQMMDTVQESIGSGWAMTFEHIFGDFEEATELWSGLADSITGFLGKSADSRNNFVKSLADKGVFTDIFTGLQNAVKPLGQIFGAVKDAFRNMFPPKSASQIRALTERFKWFTEGLVLSEETLGKLTTIFQGAFSIFSTLWEIVKSLGSAFLNLIPEGTGGALLDVLEKVALMAINFNTSVKEGNFLTETIEKLGEGLGTLISWLVTGIGKVGEFASNLRENLGKALSWISEKLKPVVDLFKESFGDVGGNELLGAGFLAAVFLVVNKIVDAFKNFSGIFDSFKGAIDDIGGGLGDLFGELGDTLNAFQEQVKFNNLLKIAIAVGILAVSLKILEGISIADLSKGIIAMAASIGILAGGMALIEKMKVTGGIRMSITLIALSTAVLIMASALKKISDLDTAEMIRGVAGLVGITAALAGAVIAMSRWSGEIGTKSISLIALATALLILSSAVQKMSKIKASSLVKSVAALGTIFAILAVFLNIVDDTKFSISSALGVVAISGAIHIIVSAIEKIAKIDSKELYKGLEIISIILAQIALFSAMVGDKGLFGAGAGMVLIAGAIRILMEPITTMSKMSWTELAKGLGGMAVAILAVAGAAKIASGSIGGAVAITVIAVALNLLMGPIEKFASMTWGGLLKAFAGLAGALLLIAGASVLLLPAVPAMILFGTALLVMGAAIALAGAGIGLFGLGMTALATLTVTSIAAIISSLGLLITGLGSLIVKIVEFVVNLGIALIDGMVQLIPSLVNAVMEIVSKILQSFADHLPDFIKTGTDIIVAFLDGIAEAIPRVVDSSINLIFTWIETMTEAIRTNGPKFTDAVLKLMGEVLLVVIDAGVKMVNALFGWIPGVKNATSEIGATAEKYIRDNFGAEGLGESKGVDFADGLTSTELEAKLAGKDVANAGKDGAEGVDMEPVGENFGGSFAGGIKNKLKAVADAAGNLASSAMNKVKNWLGIASPSKVATRFGQWFGDGLGNGIKNRVRYVGQRAKELAMQAKDTTQEFLKGFNPEIEDREMKIKLVLDDDDFDPDKYNPDPFPIQPDTSLTSGLVSSIRRIQGQNKEMEYRRDNPQTDSNSNEDSQSKAPAVIQVVTPDKREVARWLVDDVTEFQEFKIATLDRF